MSCLFNSLSHFLQEDSFTIRQKICDYLQNNGKIIEDLETNFILDLENPNYITDMRNMTTWGGAIEIQSACNIWNIRIIVKDIRNQPNKEIEFIPVNADYQKTINIEWGGGHYEPIS